MKAFVYTQTFLILLLIVGINGRHVEQSENEETETGEESKLLHHKRDHGQMRHRRRTPYIEDYQYSAPYGYDYRRDPSTRQQEELYSRVLKSLDEIITHLRRPPPPPPPQPIYIPYPVIQYVPSSCSHPRPRPDVPQITVTTEAPAPNVTERFPVIEDENQLWGIPIDEAPEEEDLGDGSRPINLEPVKPNRPMRPAPPVEHGSVQAGMEPTTAAPVRRPGACETAILTCCTIQERTAQRNCFARYDCLRTYATNRACEPAVIKRVLEHFTSAYAPVRN